MATILVTTSSFGKNDNSTLDPLKNRGLAYELNPYGRKLTQDEIIELLHRHQPKGLIAGVEPLNKTVLEHAKKLKVISRCGIGMDNIDFEVAREMGIKVVNTPDAPTIPVAELTVGLILSLLRKIHRSDQAIRTDRWIRPMGNLLSEKTVGIIGCGRIGSYVAKLLVSFGCRVLGFDPCGGENKDIQLMGLDEVLVDSDIVTLHMPYSDENRHFVDYEFLKKMKKSSILINASRGGIVDESALQVSLENRDLAGAALDCFEKEPYTGPLKTFDNVVLTSHIGSYALEGRIMMEKQSVENLLREL